MHQSRAKYIAPDFINKHRETTARMTAEYGISSMLEGFEEFSVVSVSVLTDNFAMPSADYLQERYSFRSPVIHIEEIDERNSMVTLLSIGETQKVNDFIKAEFTPLIAMIRDWGGKMLKAYAIDCDRGAKLVFVPEDKMKVIYA